MIKDIGSRRFLYQNHIFPALMLALPSLPVIGPKVFAVSPSLIILTALFAISREQIRELLPRMQSLKLVIALTVYGICLAALSPQPRVALLAVTSATIVATISVFNWHVVDSLTPDARMKSANFFLVGYVVASLIGLAVVGASFKSAAFTQLRLEYAYFPVAYNRAAVTLALLLPAVIGIIYSYWRGSNAHSIVAVVSSLSFLTCLLSVSETSQIALLVGVVAFYGFRRFTWLAPRASMLILVVVYFSWMPVSKYISTWIDASYPMLSWAEYGSIRTRLMYWANAYDRVFDGRVVLLGGGANAMAAQRILPTGLPMPPGATWHPHPHSAVVQTWTDGGLIGVTIALGCIGLALWRINVMSSPQREAMAATLLAFLVAWSGSHGMWQSWFHGLGGFAFVCCALAAPTREAAVHTNGMRRQRCDID